MAIRRPAPEHVGITRLAYDVGSQPVRQILADRHGWLACLRLRVANAGSTANDVDGLLHSQARPERVHPAHSKACDLAGSEARVYGEFGIQRPLPRLRLVEAPEGVKQRLNVDHLRDAHLVAGDGGTIDQGARVDGDALVPNGDLHRLVENVGRRAAPLTAGDPHAEGQR